MVVGIGFEDPDRGATCSRLAAQLDTVPLEVVPPPLTAWMVQRDDRMGLWIDAGKVAALVEIAVDARQSEIAQCVGTTVLFGNNVLNVEQRQG